MTLRPALVANPAEAATGSDRPRGIFEEGLTSPLLHLQILLFVALFLGGGGLAYGLRNLVIQLCALAILAFHRGLVWQFVREAPLMLRILLGASMALPLVQLIPLPPTLWQGLPGREPVIASFELARVDPSSWFPASLDAARTLVAFCGTLAPATIIMIGSQLSEEQKHSLIRAALLACLAAFALGAVQITSANTAGLLYSERTSAGTFYATFTNRNSTAMLFVLAIAMLAALPRPKSPAWMAAGLAAGAVFALAIVLTQSRSGMALLMVIAAFWLVRLAFGLMRREGGSNAPGGRTVILALTAMALLGGALGYSYISGGRVADSMERFSAGAADRPEMWEDSAYAAGQYWPVGSGMGTFDEVFQTHESLEHVSSRKAGRAHSDWLEIAIEGGLAALILAVGWLIWCLWAAVPRGGAANVWMPLAAGAGLGCIALQSLLDYPLRNQSLLCFAALFAVMLVRSREAKP